VSRTAILGNSGSGKTTLARELSARSGAPVLDLDSIVWEPGKIAVPRAPEAALAELDAFCASSEDWIVEGCYADLIAATLRWTPELVFVNPGEDACLRHCRSRPWEPSKYASKAEQDSKLEFLLAWVSDYYRREGTMSLKAHRDVFDGYNGPKRETR
jgi:adenylate kinase family enzyme